MIHNSHSSKKYVTSIKVSKWTEGETIEEKIKRITTNREPISDGAPLIYTDRSAGVQPQYDVRTDRFEKAIEAMDAVTKSHLAKREERQAANKEKLAQEAKSAEALKNLGKQAKDGMSKEGEA